MDTICNLGRLLFDSNENIASLVIKTLVAAIVSNLLDSITDDLLIIKSSLCCDFAENHNHTSLGGSLAGDLGKGIRGKAGIKLDVRRVVVVGGNYDGIRNLIADFIGMAFSDGF
jgi:hypothetical protein